MTNAEAPATGIERRHDLDALRAFAMLLGIVLHGALAFIPGAWAVTDASAEGEGTPFGLLVEAIHGFRMPLFFLMSGFFTAMLWRQRGLRTLVRQRAQRLLLPLLIAMLTVIPLTWAAWGYATGASGADDNGGANTGAEATSEAEDDVWQAAKRGDIAALERFAAEGASLDAPEPDSNTTPLAWAALHGHVAAAKWLLDNGAEVNTLNGDGSTALHSAAFMGRVEIVRLMLERGANPHARHPNGALPIHSSRADAGTTAYYVGALGLTYDQATLDAGREEVAQLLTEAMKQPAPADPAGEEAGPSDERTDVAGGVAPYRSDPDADVDKGRDLLVPWYWDMLYARDWGGLFTFDVFSHLWFLWYLLWLVGAFALIVWAAARIGLRWPRLSAPLVVTPALYLWAAPLTMAVQYFMGVEGQLPVFGTDTYTGILPAPHVLLYYGIFFAFGAVYFGHNEGGARIGRWWQATLPLALIVFIAGVTLTHPEEGGAAQGWARAASLFLQAAYAWMMTLGLMGLFRAVLGGEGNARVRYLSDASYWLYLMHLPLIIALQSVAQDWALPASVKLVLLIAVTGGTLLLVYEWGVRYTPLGTLLNGRRTRTPADSPAA